MRRFLVWTVVVVAALGGAFWWVIGRLDHVRLTDSVHVYTGVGGNVGVLVTSEGVVVVDTMTFVRQGELIRRAVRELTDQPIVTVLNTHYHLDHTHGNPAFPVGTKVVSTGKTLQHLRELDGSYWKERPAQDLLPNDTFDAGSKEMRLGGKTIRSYYFGRGHTDGDMVVLFVEDRVLHTGDLFSNGRYPNIDLEAGGSVREWVAAIDRVLELDFDKVIPGHGPVTDREGLRAFQKFMRQLADAGDQAMKNGWTLEQTEREAKIDADAGYKTMSIPFVVKLDRDFAVRRAWEEATGKVQRIELPEATQ